MVVSLNWTAKPRQFDMIDRLLPTTRLTWLKQSRQCARRAGDRQNAGGYPRQPGRDHCHHHRHHPGAVEVMAQMNVVEMMMALQKMRARRPSNQCHVTNLKDNPVQIAADAAEAGSVVSQNRKPRSVSPAMRRLTPWRCWSVPNAVVPAC
jgi:hypothetical protein